MPELPPGSSCCGQLSCELTDRALSGQIGPVTNVGTLLQLHPELAPRVQSIVMVAARRPGQSFVSSQGNGQQQTPHPDLNFDCDVDAMRLLLDTEVPLVFAPWEVSDKVWLTRDDLDALANTESEAAQYLAHHSRSWLESWVSMIGFAGFNPFDSLAVAAISHPEKLHGQPPFTQLSHRCWDREPTTVFAHGRFSVRGVD